MKLSNWFICPQLQPKARMRLVCFPYAGGGVSLFHAWQNLVGPHIEVWMAYLPGRGARLREPVYTRMQPLVTELVAAIEPLSYQPVVFFGHSFGARIAFELTQVLRNTSASLPKQLFLSACAAPQLPDRSLALHTLSDKALLVELGKRGGVPQEVMAQPALLEALIPALRGDLAVLETAVYRPQPPLDIPITVFGGTADSAATPLELDAWRIQTKSDFRTQLFVGDHFFMETAVVELTRTIKHELETM